MTGVNAPRRRSRKARRGGAAWWPVLRDMGATVLATFVLVWQTVFEATAQAVLVAAALALYGIPASSSLTRYLARKLLEEEERS